MIDVDEVVRRGLADAAGTVAEPSPSQLASALAARQSGRGRTSHRRLTLAAAALLVVCLAAGAAAVVRSGDDPARVRTGPNAGEPGTATSTPLSTAPTPAPPTTTEPSTTSQPTAVVPEAAAAGWAALGPGWHTIDTGPVPAGYVTSIAWTGTEMVVAAADDAFAYDPALQSWRSIDLPADMGYASIAWAEDRLLALSRGRDYDLPLRSASWDPVSGSWTDLGEVPIAPALTEVLGATATGPTSGGHLALIWTGKRLLDVTHLAAFDPTTGTWSAMATPSDLIDYTALLYTDVVWTGVEVVAVAWSNQPGLAWNATGTEYREVPAIPESIFGAGSAVPAAVATVDGGRIVLVAEPEGREVTDRSSRAATLDPVSGQWSALVAPPDVGEPRSCSFWAVSVREQAIIGRCDEGASLLLGDGTWGSIASGEGTRPYQRPVEVGGALVVWNSDDDTVNNPDAPYIEAAVWVPTDA